MGITKEDWDKRILIGLTAKKGKGWKKKLEEIKKYKIKRFALFVEEIPLKKRPELYKELLKLDIEEIPLIHIREDITVEELEFFKKNFKTNCFTIHENHFDNLPFWEKFSQDLFLEFNRDGIVDTRVDMHKIGGFCVDFSHFKASEEDWSNEFEYILERRDISKYFKCNHLNGYSYKENRDLHRVKNLKEFAYLKTLPLFLFGEDIALEMYNSVEQQLKFKEYLIDLLYEKFKEKT